MNEPIHQRAWNHYENVCVPIRAPVHREPSHTHRDRDGELRRYEGHVCYTIEAVKTWSAEYEAVDRASRFRELA